MKIALVKMSSMGDIIHTLPAVTDFYKINPEVRFTWIVEEGFNEIPSWHPAVERVISINLRRLKKEWRTKEPWQDFYKHFHELGEEPYDGVIDAQGLIKSALVTKCLHGPRHGYDKTSARERWASICYQHQHVVSTEMHAIDRIRELFAKAFAYNLPSPTIDYGISREQFTNKTPSTSPVVFIHSSSRDEKCWPEQNWRKLAELCTKANIPVLLPWGSHHEHVRAERIAHELENCTVLPKMSLTQLAELLAHAKQVIAVDTGLAHLTAALGTPCLTLYGPTDTSKIGTRGDYQEHGKLNDDPGEVFGVFG